MEKRRTTSIPWVVVILCLVFLPPLGVILLLVKLTSDRTMSFGGGSGILKFLSIILLFIAGLFLVMALTESDLVGPGIFLVVLFGLPGVWLYKKGNQIKRDGAKNREYINLIVNNQVHDVHEVARRMNISQDMVIKDVNVMINRGMLGRARLNLNTGKIEFPKRVDHSTPQARHTASGYRQSTPHRDIRNNASRPVQGQRQTHERPTPRSAQNEYKPFEPKTIRCKSCSANNFVESLPAVCDYCGSSLHE